MYNFKVMKIQITTKLQAEIDPLEVILKLQKEEITRDSYVEQIEDKFYVVHYQKNGPFEKPVHTEITENRFRYIESLEIVKRKLSGVYSSDF